MRARRSTPSNSAGVFAAAYAFRMGTMLLETCVAAGKGAIFDEAWLVLVVPTVVSEPETDLASSSSSGRAEAMPMLAASEGWCDLLVGIDDEAAAAVRTTFPLLSELAGPLDLGMAFMVVTLGILLDNDAGLEGEAVRLPTLGFDDGTLLRATVFADRKEAGAADAVEAVLALSPGLVVPECVSEPTTSGFRIELLPAARILCPRLRTEDAPSCNVVAASALVAVVLRRDPERLRRPPAMPRRDLRDSRPLSCVLESRVPELSLDLGVRRKKEGVRRAFGLVPGSPETARLCELAGDGN